MNRSSQSSPLISIVVPSYNQDSYLEACIRSIIHQDYPKFELIVMDGGSTDGSIEIIEKYTEHFAYWQAQPDRGQTAAIVVGFEHATGDLLTWLNSDDILLPGALRSFASAFQRNPNADVFYGHHVVIDTQGAIVERYKHPRYYSKLAWLTMPYIAQPGTLFTPRIWEKVDGADVSMQCAFDCDLWYRFMVANARFVNVKRFVAGFRKHPESKGMTWLEQYAQEHATLRERYQDYWGTPFQRRVARLTLMGIQVLSGNYFHTLAFRLWRHHRFSAYKPR